MHETQRTKKRLPRKQAVPTENTKPRSETNRINSTVLIGIEIPFWKLVKFFITCAIAAIPAGILVSLFRAGVTILSGVFIGLLSGLIR